MKIYLTLIMLVLSFTIPIVAQDDETIEAQLHNILDSLSTNQYYLTIDGAIISDNEFIPAEPRFPVFYTTLREGDDADMLQMQFTGQLEGNTFEQINGAVQIYLSYYMEAYTYIDIAGSEIPLHDYGDVIFPVFWLTVQGQASETSYYFTKMLNVTLIVEQYYPVFTGAFDFILEDDDGEQVHVRGASKNIDNPYMGLSYPQHFPEVTDAGEFGMGLSGALISVNSEESQLDFCQTANDDDTMTAYLNFYIDALDSTSDQLQSFRVEIIIPERHINQYQDYVPVDTPILNNEMTMSINQGNEALYKGFDYEHYEFSQLWLNSAPENELSGGAIITAHRDRQSYVIFATKFIEIPIKDCN